VVKVGREMQRKEEDWLDKVRKMDKVINGLESELRERVRKFERL